MVMNVLKQQFGSVNTGYQMMEEVGPGHDVCAERFDYTVHN
jgi:hypothetical protein